MTYLKVKTSLFRYDSKDSGKRKVASRLFKTVNE